jgi:hypothetical protein
MTRKLSAKRAVVRASFGLFSLRPKVWAAVMVIVSMFLAPSFWFLPELRDWIPLRMRLYVFLFYFALAYAFWRLGAHRDEAFARLTEAFLKDVKARRDLEQFVILVNNDDELKAWICSRYPDYNDVAFITYLQRTLRGR